MRVEEKLCMGSSLHFAKLSGFEVKPQLKTRSFIFSTSQPNTSSAVSPFSCSKVKRLWFYNFVISITKMYLCNNYSITVRNLRVLIAWRSKRVISDMKSIQFPGSVSLSAMPKGILTCPVMSFAEASTIWWFGYRKIILVSCMKAKIANNTLCNNVCTAISVWLNMAKWILKVTNTLSKISALLADQPFRVDKYVVNEPPS